VGSTAGLYEKLVKALFLQKETVPTAVT